MRMVSTVLLCFPGFGDWCSFMLMSSLCCAGRLHLELC